MLWHPSEHEPLSWAVPGTAGNPGRGRPPRAADVVGRHVPQPLHPLRGSGHARSGDPGAHRLRALRRRRRASASAPRASTSRSRWATASTSGRRRTSGVVGRSSAIGRRGPRAPEEGLVWAKHCAEEIGNWGVFLPQLYDLYRVVIGRELNPFADLSVVREDGIVRYRCRHVSAKLLRGWPVDPRRDRVRRPRPAAARSASSRSPTGRSGRRTPAAASCGSLRRDVRSWSPSRSTPASRSPTSVGAVHDRRDPSERARVRRERRHPDRELRHRCDRADDPRRALDDALRRDRRRAARQDELRARRLARPHLVHGHDAPRAVDALRERAGRRTGTSGSSTRTGFASSPTASSGRTRSASTRRRSGSTSSSRTPAGSRGSASTTAATVERVRSTGRPTSARSPTDSRSTRPATSGSRSSTPTG